MENFKMGFLTGYIMGMIYMLAVAALTGCASLSANSWQNNPCNVNSDSDACKHKKYLESIKR